MDNPSLDPLTYFSNIPHILDYVFQHLNSNDLLQISCTNKAYHQNVFNSKVCLDKIRVVIHNEEELSCRRNYRAMKFEKRDKDPGTFFDWLFSRNKPGNIKNLKFLEEFHNLKDLILMFPPKLDHPLNLSNLTHLTVSNTKHDNAFAIISAADNLVSLDISHVDCAQNLLTKLGREERWKQMVWNCQCCAKRKFTKRMQLEELKVFGFYEFLSEESERRGLMKFLDTQKDSLKRLRLCYWVGQDLFKSVFSLPNLELFEILGIMPYNNFDWSSLEIFVNRNVKTLFIGEDHLPPGAVEFYLRSCPEAETLYLYEIKKEYEKIFREFGQNLKIIEAKMFVEVEETKYDDDYLKSHRCNHETCRRPTSSQFDSDS